MERKKFKALTRVGTMNRSTKGHPHPGPLPSDGRGCQALWGCFMVGSQTLDLGDRENLLRVHLQVADGLGDQLARDLAFPGQRVEGRDDRALRVDLEEAP